MTVEVIAGGTLTTLQDLGRFGFAAQGFGSSGACDKHAMRLANALLGNALATAVLECTLLGSTLRFSEASLVAVAGGMPTITLNDEPVSAYRPIPVQAGDVLHIGLIANGLRSYVAFSGGINTPLFMGSRATDLRTGIGGLHGRALTAHDLLPIKSDARSLRRFLHTLPDKLTILDKMDCFHWMAHTLGPFRYIGAQKTALVRCVLGPQAAYFTQKGLDTFANSLYEVTVDSNRMACKLRGAKIEAVSGFDIISDGIMEGSVQVSAEGQPLVMLADHQTTGGYAKIATIISVDIPTLAQLRPGDAVAFRYVSSQEALLAIREENAMLCKIKELMSR